MVSDITKLLTSKNISNCSIIIGAKGTGKTTMILNKKHNKQIMLIVTPKSINKQIGSDIIMNFENFIKIDENKLNNFKIVFDDCKHYISHNPNETNTKKIISLLINSRHANNEIYLIYHSFTEVNEKIWSKLDNIYLFKTVTSIENTTNVIPNYKDIFQAEQSLKDKNTHEFEVIKIDI